MTEYKRPEWIDKAPVQYQEILEKHDMWLKDIEGGARANLSGANLSRANLSGANLSGANLSGADLSRANLSRADLSGAYLSGAYLSDANLSGADLSGANLSGAYLSGANLSRANLSGANLSGANLSGANLSGADLSDANLSEIKKDFIDAISKLPDEVPFLRQALIEGKVDGSTYKGECACLAGTIAKHMGKDVDHGTDLGNGFVACADSPRERFFLGIRPGNTPENNPISKIVVEWIDEAFPGAKG